MCERRITKQPENRKTNEEGEEDEEAEPVDLNTIFVWLDLFALPQQYLGGLLCSDLPNE